MAKYGLKVDVRLEGLRELQRYLRRIPPKVEKLATEKMIQRAEEQRDLARMLVAKDTHSLEKSIQVDKTPVVGAPPHYIPTGDIFCQIGVSAGNHGVINPKTGKEVDYQGYVEHGTSKMAARPYMRPAWEIVRPKLERDMKEAAEEAVKP